MRVRKSNERGATMITPVPYIVQTPYISECPRSAVTQESEDLVQIVSGLLEGESMLTMAADQVSGHLIDAIRIAQRETRAQEVAQDEAVHNT